MTDALLDRPFVNRMGLRPGITSIASIIGRVADRYGLTLAQLKGRQNRRQWAKARHEAFWECTQYTTASLPELAKVFQRDHTTIFYGAKKHARRIGANGAT